MTKKMTEGLKQIIKQQFIEGVVQEDGTREYPTIDALIKTHEVAKNTAYRHSQKEDWQAQKNRFQSTLQEKVTKARVIDLAKEASRLDENAINIAQALLSRVGNKLARTIERERNNPSYEGLQASELRELSHVAANAQKIGKLALGEAQEISKVSADVTAPDSYVTLVRELEELAQRKASLGKHTIQ